MVNFDSDFSMLVLYYGLGFVIDILKLCELEEFVIQFKFCCIKLGFIQMNVGVVLVIVYGIDFS